MTEMKTKFCQIHLSSIFISFGNAFLARKKMGSKWKVKWEQQIICQQNAPTIFTHNSHSSSSTTYEKSFILSFSFFSFGSENTLKWTFLWFFYLKKNTFYFAKIFFGYFLQAIFYCLHLHLLQNSFFVVAIFWLKTDLGRRIFRRQSSDRRNKIKANERILNHGNIY